MVTADDIASGFKVEKLMAENYHSWTFSMTMLLLGKDLWDIVNGTETLSESANATERSKFKKA